MGAEIRGEPDPSQPVTNGPAGAGEHLVSPALVGRDDELARLVAAVSAPPVVAVVEGEAGVGKTRLVEELLASPELSGRRWLTGRCRQIREPFPLGAVIEAVRGLGEELRELDLGPVAGALRPLVPELAQWLPAAPEALDDRQAERHRVFRGLAELLTALARIRPVMLVLEDVHWADGQTQEFIGYWLSSPGPDVALVITYRSEDASAEVSALTARLPRPVGYEHLSLAPLDEHSTGALTAAILGIDTVSAEFAATWQLPGYGGCGGQDWLSATPATVTVAAGQTATVKITLNAGAPSVTQPGTYTASFRASNDTPNGASSVPVTFTVNPPRAWGKLAGTVTGTTCAGASRALPGATVQVGEGRTTWTLSADTGGGYALWLPAASKGVSVITSLPGWQPQVATVAVRAGATTSHDVTLQQVCG